jgi:predicted metallo-beta-lactamase superfamily hydrolase
VRASGLQENELLDYDNYHLMDPIIPRIHFSHYCYANLYIDNRDSKRDYYNEKVVLMVRDPQDAVASNHPQWINSANPYMKNLLNIPNRPVEIPRFEYAMKKQFDIPRTVDFLKNRAPEIDHPIQQRPELHDYTSRNRAGI